MKQEQVQDLLDHYDRRRAPIPGEVDFGLPAVDTHFGAAKSAKVKNQEGFRFQSFLPSATETNFKLDTLAKELEGESELKLLHAYLISHLRKRDRPLSVHQLFIRLWREEADYLLAELPPRWVLSAVISFAVCGENENQRSTGVAFNMFFSLVKLYEFERLFSGKKPKHLFKLERKVRADLPVGLTPFSLKNGDLDTNTLAQLYEIGRRDELTRRPCDHLFSLLMHDSGNLFLRLGAMKGLANIEGR